MSAKPDCCQHCNRRGVYRRRGTVYLCVTCYQKREVRRLYTPSHPPYGNGTQGAQRRRPPTAPTDALPGTEAKMQIMEERLAAGFEARHPDDARWEDE